MSGSQTHASSCSSIHRELTHLRLPRPSPTFGERWRSLFRPIRDVVGSREEWLRAYARGAVS